MKIVILSKEAMSVKCLLVQDDKNQRRHGEDDGAGRRVIPGVTHQLSSLPLALVDIMRIAGRTQLHFLDLATAHCMLCCRTTRRTTRRQR